MTGTPKVTQAERRALSQILAVADDEITPGNIDQMRAAAAPRRTFRVLIRNDRGGQRREHVRAVSAAAARELITLTSAERIEDATWTD
jgi:hypothetical protein